MEEFEETGKYGLIFKETEVVDLEKGKKISKLVRRIKDDLIKHQKGMSVRKKNA